jgi:hypothetical protein
VEHATEWCGGSPVVLLAHQGQNQLFMFPFVLLPSGRTPMATGDVPLGTLATATVLPWVVAPLDISPRTPQALSSHVSFLSSPRLSRDVVAPRNGAIGAGREEQAVEGRNGSAEAEGNGFGGGPASGAWLAGGEQLQIF